MHTRRYYIPLLLHTDHTDTDVTGGAQHLIMLVFAERTETGRRQFNFTHAAAVGPQRGRECLFFFRIVRLRHNVVKPLTEVLHFQGFYTKWHEDAQSCVWSWRWSSQAASCRSGRMPVEPVVVHFPAAHRLVSTLCVCCDYHVPLQQTRPNPPLLLCFNFARNSVQRHELRTSAV